jgi:ribosomal protein S6--L-glutamate ligase
MNKFSDYRSYTCVILSVPPDPSEESGDVSFTTDRIIKEGKKLGINVLFFDLNTTYIDDNLLICADHPKGVEINEESLLILARGSITERSSWINLLKQLEHKHITCINSSECSQTCSDKYQTYLALKEANVPQPHTNMLISECDPDDYTFPIILKTTRGSKGIGVLFIESFKALKSTVQLLKALDENVELIVQEFVDIKFDVRALVLNGKVQACMKRHVVKDDFRSNFSQGGKIEKYNLTPNEKTMVLNAADAVKGSWVGVDFIVNPKGKPMVLEVNNSSGTEGIEKATGKNLNKEFLQLYQNPDNWTKYKIESGVIERVDIPKIGPIKAKMDTGNSIKYSVIHNDTFKIKGKKVEWEIFGKKMVSDFVGMHTVDVGGIGKYDEERPVIELDVEFNGKTYKKTLFTLDDRSERSSDILFNRVFIIGANLLINCALTYHLTDEDKSFKSEEK